MVALLTLAATVLGVYWGLRPFFEDPPAARAMTGDFNIAVASFGAADATGRVEPSEAGEELAQSLADRLEVELEPFEESGFDLQVRPPTEMARLTGATPEERVREAEAQARKIKADLVVYGTIRPVGDTPAFVPELFLNEQKLPRAEELVGQHDLGSSIPTTHDFAQSVVARKELRERLLGRTNALTNLVLGLSYYSGDRLEDAARHFEAARVAPGWDDADGKEVIYLFLGNVAGKLGDLDAAAAHFARALELEPEYARAESAPDRCCSRGLATDCAPGDVDATGLDGALGRFQAATRATVQSPLADIGTKSAFGEGQVYLCLSQALVADRWADAQANFERVIADYGGKNPRLRDTAAEAYSNLGFIHLPFAADAPDAPARYRQALADYDRAIDTTRLNDRRAFFHSMRGFILARLGDRNGAVAAYGEAIRLEPDETRRQEYEARRQAVDSPP